MRDPVNKLRIASAVVLVLLAVLVAATMPIITVLAQATATYTATATHTPYPFATTTPGPTITPLPTCPTGPIAPNWIDMSCSQATTIYASSNCVLDPVTHEVISCTGSFSAMGIISDIWGKIKEAIQKAINDIKNGIQKLIDITTNIKDSFDLALVSIDTRTNKFGLIIRGHSPFPFMRGMMIIFADFEWLGIIGVWLIIAAIDITAITAIRFVVSMWGVVQRVIDLIKLIPFV